ncbi:MAG: hypothetical protein HQL76_17805 [Magnetococcales bacterium]|nr:hypothetical protein [Magnetococcales bacterium]
MFSTGGLHIDQAPPLNLPFRFFATAPLFLFMAAVSLVFHGSDLLITPLAPETIATVHLVVLGWICMVMFGAMYQMIPVLAGLPVPWPRLAPWVHGLLTMGVVTLFLGLATRIHPWMLLFASMGLGGAVLLFVVPILTALWRAPSRHPAVVAMRMAAVSLLGVLTLGGIFLGEYAHGFLDLDRMALLTTHLIWGLFGWVGTLIIGVSFQVLPMFYMTGEIPRQKAGHILAGLGLFLIGQPVALYFVHPGQWYFWLPTLPFLFALVTYIVQMRLMLRGRKRKMIDLTFRFWLLGFASGLAALPLVPLWPFMDADWSRFLFGGLFLFGFASSIILGMLYKIIPFLVWFHRFSRLAGLVDIPMMDDLVPPKGLKWQFPVHLLVVVGAVLFFVSGWEPMSWFLAAMLGIDAALLLHTLWFALGHKPPQQEILPDFASFFKDTSWMKPPEAPNHSITDET